MGNSEDGKPTKPEKSSPVTTDQTSAHVYPDWAAMQFHHQAYYGPQVAVPPYFNPAVASGHPHPYMWGPPQSMMSPYGTPYTALYAHGGVYAHCGVPLASASLSMEMPTKPSGNSSQSLVKKLKEVDGLAMSIGNGNVDSAEGGANHGVSESGETEGSSDGSNGNRSEACQNGKKRNREGTPESAGDGKGKLQLGTAIAQDVNGAADKMLGVTVAPANAGEKATGTVISANMTMTLELRNSTTTDVNNSTNGHSCSGIPAKAWLNNERELKRERRKQSNRESARRSRLRKQAEAEELAVRVQSLTAENASLQSEINKLTENSEKLKLENAALMEKLKNIRGQTEDIDIAKIEDKRLQQPVHTADLLARVNNSACVDENDDETKPYKKKNSGAKRYPVLRASPRTDAVAAR